MSWAGWTGDTGRFGLFVRGLAMVTGHTCELMGGGGIFWCYLRGACPFGVKSWGLMVWGRQRWGLMVWGRQNSV